MARISGKPIMASSFYRGGKWEQQGHRVKHKTTIKISVSQTNFFLSFKVMLFSCRKSVKKLVITMSEVYRWAIRVYKFCYTNPVIMVPSWGRSPGEGDGTLLQYSCLENPVDRGCLVGYSPWGHKESDTTERLRFHFHCHSLAISWLTAMCQEIF